MEEYHKAVLLQESVDALVGGERDGVYVDATFGGGGHSREILKNLSPKGRLMAFDRDADALQNKPEDERLVLIHHNFRFIENFVKAEWPARGDKRDGVNGVLADLGVSSHQFDTAERGFSFRFEAPLDMRMNRASGKTAQDIVNGYEPEALEQIFRLYGEVENSRKAAQLIERARKEREIVTTTDLNKALESITPAVAGHKYLAKVYQALRIEVNDEMRSLEKMLEGAAVILKTGGRLVVITYHSLEDRMVKNFFKSGNIAGKVEKDLYGRSKAPLKPLGKMVCPTEAEIGRNTRARSAKMRVAVKL
ncbi:MAG: 16S rRNA (cytosine(1402)-N(4))-methyltransferase RsmH [Bacteroidales bacterium]|nr:16S rRNA (cytosine(1402)-N(4))-methyltransferase RsmH [Bacteroidales bacterium]